MLWAQYSASLCFLLFTSTLAHISHIISPSALSTARPVITRRPVYGLKNHPNASWAPSNHTLGHSTFSTGLNHDTTPSKSPGKSAADSNSAAAQSSDVSLLPDSGSDDSQSNFEMPGLTNDTTSSSPDGPSDDLIAIMSSSNHTCTEIATWTGPEIWEGINGDEALANFTTMFNKNAVMCEQCFGLTVDQCPEKNNKSCSRGLKDLSTLPHAGGASWSVAAGFYGRVDGLNSYTCTLGPNQCSTAPSCDIVRTGPSAWLILESLSIAHNAYQLGYDSMSDAAQKVDMRTTDFTHALAPIPNTASTAMGLIIASAVIGGLFGLIPGLGGAVAGMIVGIGSGVGLEEYFTNQPTPADARGPLEQIFASMQSTLYGVTESLFRTGEYLHTGRNNDSQTVRLQDFMGNGSLVSADGNETYSPPNMSTTYQHLMFQQLGLITWTKLETDGYNHTPFIAFDTVPCAKVDPTLSTSIGQTQIPGVGDLDVSVDFQGSCYYLLDAVPNGEGSISDPVKKCKGYALPGGTHTEMNQNNFSGLCVEDFVIPSVLGWLNNSKANGYQSAFELGDMVQDPQAQGVVNLPVCDLLASSQSGIGVGCPLIAADENAITNSCPLVPPNDGPAPAGSYQAGKCGVSVQQYQRTESNENPFHSYQLAVTITDGLSRIIGEATKQLASETLDIVDSSLPFDLYVSPGTSDLAPVQFWYSDQFWDSSNTSPDNDCNSTGYATGVRRLYCSFDCPNPSDDPNAQQPISATIAHPFPNTPISAVAGATILSNTFISRSASASASGVPSSTTPLAPTYATGICTARVRQYQKHETSPKDPNQNPTNDYEIAVWFEDTHGTPINGVQDSQLPAPVGVPVTISGLVSPFIVTCGGIDSDPVNMTYAGQSWSSENHPPCNVGPFDGGARDMDCTFSC